jgi:hypothetical protein
MLADYSGVSDRNCKTKIEIEKQIPQYNIQPKQDYKLFFGALARVIVLRGLQQG